MCFASGSAPWKACQVTISKMEEKCLLKSFLLGNMLACCTFPTFGDGYIEFIG